MEWLKVHPERLDRSRTRPRGQSRDCSLARLLHLLGPIGGMGSRLWIAEPGIRNVSLVACRQPPLGSLRSIHRACARRRSDHRGEAKSLATVFFCGKSMVGRCYATGSVSRSLGLASGTIAPDSLAAFSSRLTRQSRGPHCREHPSAGNRDRRSDTSIVRDRIPANEGSWRADRARWWDSWRP